MKTRPLEAGPAKAGSIEALPGKALPGEAGAEKTHKTDQNFPSALTLNLVLRLDLRLNLEGLSRLRVFRLDQI